MILPTENILHSFANNSTILVGRVGKSRDVMLVMRCHKTLSQRPYGSIDWQARVQTHDRCLRIVGMALIQHLRSVELMDAGIRADGHANHETAAENPA